LVYLLIRSIKILLKLVWFQLILNYTIILSLLGKIEMEL